MLYLLAILKTLTGEKMYPTSCHFYFPTFFTFNQVRYKHWPVALIVAEPFGWGCIWWDPCYWSHWYLPQTTKFRGAFKDNLKNGTWYLDDTLLDFYLNNPKDKSTGS